MDIERLKISNHADFDTQACYLYFSDINEVTDTPHCHDFFEIMLCLEGKAFHHINGQTIIFEKNNLILIRPDDTHSFEKIPDLNLKFINLAFPVDTIMEAVAFLGSGFDLDELLSSHLPPCINLSEIEKNILSKNINSLYLLPYTNKLQIKLGLRSILIYILTNYFVLYNYNPHIDKIPRWLEELCLEMKSKENFVLGVQRMVEISGRSHEHICRLFKKYYSATPLDFINELKLNYAANLLIKSNLSIIDICSDLGFESLSRFYHLFKAKYSVTPASFRKKYSEALR